jgi:hypothetical protein
MGRMSAELELIEQQLEALTSAEQYLLLLYRVSAYITLNVIDDAAMLAFGLS